MMSNSEARKRAAANEASADVEALAAWLIGYHHPTQNALTRPEDPLTMVRTNPTFFICADALKEAAAILASDWLAAHTAAAEARGAQAVLDAVEAVAVEFGRLGDEANTQAALKRANGVRDSDRANVWWRARNKVRAAAREAARNAGAS